MPTKSPGLMSSTDALATPATFKPGLSVTALVGPFAGLHRKRRSFEADNRAAHVHGLRRLAGDRAASPRTHCDGERAAEAWASFGFIASTLQNGLLKPLVATPRRKSTGPQA